MSCILNPALLMRCKESLGDVPDDKLDAGKHIQLGKVSFNAGDKLQIFIVYVPLGKYSPDGVAWTGTSSKCSSIGFIAHADNWTRSYGAIHPPARAYLEVGAGCTLEQTFTISVTEQLNIGIYAIINNGWANGYDNQCFLVEGYSIRKNGSVLYEAGDPTACLNFRVGGKNYTPVCRVASPTTTALRFRSRTITGPTTDTIPVNTINGTPYSQGSFNYAYLNTFGLTVRTGGATKVMPSEAYVTITFNLSLRLVQTGTSSYQVYLYTSLASGNINASIVSLLYSYSTPLIQVDCKASLINTTVVGAYIYYFSKRLIVRDSAGSPSFASIPSITLRAISYDNTLHVPITLSVNTPFYTTVNIKWGSIWPMSSIY